MKTDSDEAKPAPASARRTPLRFAPGPGRLLSRMRRAALLEKALYEEVEADRGATREALAVVMLSALAAGIGGFASGGAVGIVWTALAALLGWYLWAYVTYLVGTRLLPSAQTVADTGQLLRTIGFSSAPGVVFVLAAVPPIAAPVFLLGALWMGVAMVVAVRQALDYESTARALAVCAIGFPVYVLVLAASLLLLGPRQV